MRRLAGEGVMPDCEGWAKARAGAVPTVFAGSATLRTLYTTHPIYF